MRKKIIFVRVATMIALSASLSGFAKETKVLAPIKQKDGWRFEQHLFAFKNRFVPNPVSFDRENRPLIRDGNYLQIMQLDGTWKRINLLKIMRKKLNMPNFQILSGPFVDEHVAVDKDGDMYTVVSSNIPGQDLKVYVLFSSNKGEDWSVHSTGYSGVAQMEKLAGNTDIQDPPPILLTSGNKLQMLIPQKTSDKKLVLGKPVIISQDNSLLGTLHSGGYSLCSAQGKTYVAFAGKKPLPGKELAGTPLYITYYDHVKKVVEKPVFLTLAGYGKPDNHNFPVVAMDSKGYIHVVNSGHNRPFLYMKSLKPYSINDGWTKKQDIGYFQENGKKIPAELLTYASLLIDKKDNIIIAARSARGGSWRRLVYIRKPANGDWEPVKILNAAGRGAYGVYYQKLDCDRNGKLYLSYFYSPGQHNAEEDALYRQKWPSAPGLKEQLKVKDFSRGVFTCNADGKWRLANTNDFLAGMGLAKIKLNTSTRPAEHKNTQNVDLQKIPAMHGKVVREIGGKFSFSAIYDKYAYIANGQNLVIFDISSPNQIKQAGIIPFEQAVDKTYVYKDTLYVGSKGRLYSYNLKANPAKPEAILKGYPIGIYNAVFKDNLLYVATFDGGFRIYDISNPSEPKQLASLKKSPRTPSIAVKGKYLYVAEVNDGLRVFDVTDPKTPKEVGHYTRPEAVGEKPKVFPWFITIKGDFLYASNGPTTKYQMIVFDISKPTQPEPIKFVYADWGWGWGWGKTLLIEDNDLYIAGNDGYYVFDISEGIPKSKVVLFGGKNKAGEKFNQVAVKDGLAVVTYDGGIRIIKDKTTLSDYHEPGVQMKLVKMTDSRLLINDWIKGVYIMDIKDPKKIRVTEVFGSAHLLDIAANKTHAFAISLNRKVLVYDLRNLVKPTTQISVSSSCRAIHVDNNRLFLADNEGIKVLDISNPEKIRELAQIPVAGGKVLSMRSKGNTLFVGQAQNLLGNFSVIDINNLKAPKTLAVLTLPNDIWSINLDKTIASLALGSDGALNVNISNLTKPFAVDRIYNPQFIPIWSVLKQGKYYYIANGAKGLKIIEE